MEVGEGNFITPRELWPLPDFPDESYEAKPFTPTKNIRRMHNWPRYGLTNDISDLASGASEQQQDYLVGIITGSLIILGFAIVWLLVLLILKCCGKRVGCASGRPRPPKRPAAISGSGPSQVGFEVARIPKNKDTSTQDGSQEAAADQSVATKVIQVVDETSPTTQSEEEAYVLAILEWRNKMKRHERTMLTTRILFMLAGTVAIIASILFFTLGAGSLVNSLTSVQGGLDLTDKTLTDAINVSTTFARSQEMVNAEKVQFAEGAKFCNATVEVGSAAADVQGIINELALASTELTSGFIVSAQNLAADLQYAQELSYDINSGVDSIKPYFYVAVVFAAILDIIILSLMVSIGCVWAGMKSPCKCFTRCIRNVLIIPCLLIFMFLAWLFCSIFVVAAVAGADFCINPDGECSNRRIRRKGRNEFNLYKM